MKVYNQEIVFREFPNEITLALNISNCPYNCKGCHSPFLREDKGEELTDQYLDIIIEKYNTEITCIGIMGGDRNWREVESAAKHIKECSNLRVGWYSGRDSFPPDINLEYFDYIKIGRWVEELGPLTSNKTNQKLYDVKTMQVIKMK